MTERMQDRALQTEAFSGNSAIGDGLKTVKLAGWGRTESMNGDFIIDDEGVPEILRTFAEHGASLPVDIEHESLPERQPATGSRGAIGWIEKIWGETGKGLFAFARWSDTGKALIREDRFRYLSPVFLIRKDDRRVVGLHSAALTNLPAIPKMERLAASQNANADTTTKAALVANAARKALGLNDDADADLVAATVTTLKARTAGVAAMETELAALKAQIQTQEVEQWLAPYSAKGVVGWGGNEADRKADREMILRMASSNREDCERVLRQRITFMPPQGRTNPPTGRQMTIINAEREYRDNPGHQKATSVVAFVQNSLREKGLRKLTDAETSELSIA